MMLSWEIPFQILISALVNFVFALPLIRGLIRYRFYKTKKVGKGRKKTRNKRYYKFLHETMDTPSSFGVLLIIDFVGIALSVWLLFGEISENFFSLVIFALCLLILGLVDDITEYFFYLKKGRWGLRVRHKLLVQFVLVVAFLLVSGNPGWFILLVSAFFVVFIINSFNITDGLDGLVGGPSLMILATYMLFEILTFGSHEFILLYTVLIGFHFVFLFFNVNPAKVFLGDVGSYSMGFIIGALGLRYNIIAMVVLLALLIFEGLSSLIQILGIKIFRRKVFLIAPFHLHLLNLGWQKNNVVFRFWIVQGILSICSVLIFLYHIQ